MSLIARCQRGFTTVTLMGCMAIGGLLVAGGFAAVTPDISISRDDQDYKQAYGAAEAGVQWYLASLARDNGYYTKCTAVDPPSPTEPAPVNNAWDGQGPDPRIWRNLPGTDPARYTVELLPAPGYTACVPGDQYSMVDPNGNLRLRVTGRSRDEMRSIVVTLRRRNFLDFVYFTHFDTMPPAAYSSSYMRNWAQTACARFRPQRYGCEELMFPTGDVVDGPMHSNDSVWTCGSPTFGRDSKDSVELGGAYPGYVRHTCDSANPTILGTHVYPGGQLALPPSNTALASLAQPGYLFSGRTRFTFEGDRMDVTRSNGTTLYDVPLPSNGVIYVQNGGSCSVGYARTQTYNSPTACGDAWVKGEYSDDLTIAATNDVIVNGNLTREEEDGGELLGLIANNFVRVYHPVTNNNGSSCNNASGHLVNPVIHAAILALNHAFLVDNWYCGDGMGRLEIHGAVAQKFRGSVGFGSEGSLASGYYKAYRYNDRLRYREPPYFLDPEQSAWRVARQNEQVPATQ